MRFVTSWLTSMLALSSCAGTDAAAPDEARLTLTFAAQAGAQPFECGKPLSGMGQSGASVEPLDLRLYVHDVRLRLASGETTPLPLVADGVWQNERVALLDFEDGTGRCEAGTIETNARLVGRAPARADYVGVSFVVGVPSDLNHLDSATAAPPLDVPGLWWTWLSGYRYLRADLASAANADGFLFHLGAGACQGSPNTGYSCAADNLPQITLEGDINRAIVLDLEPIFAQVDLEQRPDPEQDLAPGCQSNAADPQCAPMLRALGLPSGEQQVFSLP
jgi:uncharacterized repeat protein (TIGR04052 family)